MVSRRGARVAAGPLSHEPRQHARTAGVTTLRLLDDVIELDGRPVARLLPKLSPTLAHRLEEAFDALDEDALYISQLEDRIAELEARLAALAPGERS